MISALDVRRKQHLVTEFLCCDNGTVANMHKKLKKKSVCR